MTPPDPQRRTVDIMMAALATAMLLVSGWILFEQFRTISSAKVAAAIVHQPGWHLAVSLMFTGVSFAALGAYDVLAVRVVAPSRISVARSFLAGASANAISNTLGFHAITATAVRYRVYARAEIATGDIARIISLTGLAIGFSYVAALVVALLIRSFSSDQFENLDRIAGLLLAAAFGLLIVWLSRSQRTIVIAQFRLALPSARLTVAQLSIGILEMAASVGALYVLMPTDLAPSFASFSIAVIIAMALGVISHAPGALGVFEAAVVSVVGGRGRADLLAAFLLYRFLYNIIPFLLAVAALGLYELVGAWKERAKAVST